jgi:hypothetical protein
MLMLLKKSTIAYLLILAVVGSFASSTVLSQTYLTYSFSLNASSSGSCWYWGLSFDATQGQRFSVTWNETGGTPTSMDLYIVAPSASSSSISGDWSCYSGPAAFFYNSGAFGSASWAAPSAGEYAVLLVNTYYNPVSGTLSIMAANATMTVTYVGYGIAGQRPACRGTQC